MTNTWFLAPHFHIWINRICCRTYRWVDYFWYFQEADAPPSPQEQRTTPDAFNKSLGRENFWSHPFSKDSGFIFSRLRFGDWKFSFYHACYRPARRALRYPMWWNWTVFQYQWINCAWWCFIMSESFENDIPK